MRVLMVGAGATGGFFGARLVAAGRDVTFLLRERRAAQVRAGGIEVVSPLGNLKVQPRVITAAELSGKPETFDLIIISTKAYQLEGAMADIAPAVGSDTILLPILNGMRQLSLLTERFGAERVMGGTVRVVADLDEAGRVHQITRLGEITYGELSGQRTERLAKVEQLMQGAGFDALSPADIRAALWQKWWILASLNSVCILARGTIGQANAAPRGTDFVLAVVAEAVAIAEANGYPADAAMLADHRKRITEAGSPLTASMYRDMVKGAPVEADHILGDLLDRAGVVPAPLLTAAYVQLKIYEASRNS